MRDVFRALYYDLDDVFDEGELLLVAPWEDLLEFVEKAPRIGIDDEGVVKEIPDGLLASDPVAVLSEPSFVLSR